jgi:hypothetical protein
MELQEGETKPKVSVYSELTGYVIFVTVSTAQDSHY